VEVIGTAAAELRVTQMRDPAEHGGDPPPGPTDRVLDLGERPRAIRRAREAVEQLAHQSAAAVVEAFDLPWLVHHVLRSVLHGA
jgi:hypothetical protein